MHGGCAICHAHGNVSTRCKLHDTQAQRPSGRKNAGKSRFCFCRQVVSTDLCGTAVTAQCTVAARFATLTAMCRHGASCTTRKRSARAAARMRASRVFGFCRQVVSADLRGTAVTARCTVAARFATLTAMWRHGASCTTCKLRGRAAARMRASRVFGFCRQVVSTDFRGTAVTAQYTVAARLATLTAMCRHGASCTTCKRRGRAAATMRASRVFGFCRQVVSTDLLGTAVTAQFTVAARFHTLTAVCRHGASCTTRKRRARASARMQASRVFGFCRQVYFTDLRRQTVRKGRGRLRRRGPLGCGCRLLR